ncbi:hypothetical protein, partial [Corynebacterium guaraldiae]|uniref:hypothetical protein n=1 Tax=Corynebacterium guaraldiae TaxID=3051103 RepID=UPI001E3157DF
LAAAGLADKRDLMALLGGEGNTGDADVSSSPRPPTSASSPRILFLSSPLPCWPAATSSALKL